MESLNNNQFKSYLKSLSITHECNRSIAQDEAGEVLVIENGNCEFASCMMIDRVEYLITESQKDILYNFLVEDARNENCTSEPFTYSDREHALSLIY